MDVSDKWGGIAFLCEDIFDFCAGVGFFFSLDGDSSDFTSLIGEFHDLVCSGFSITGIGSGHGLDTDGVIAAYADVADHDFARFKIFLHGSPPGVVL